MKEEWELVCEESGKNNSWKKTTRKMKTKTGEIFQTSTEFRDGMGNVTQCSEALVFIPEK